MRYSPPVGQNVDNTETVLALLLYTNGFYLCVCATSTASPLKQPAAPLVWKTSVIFTPQSNHGLQMELKLVTSKASCKCPLQMPQTTMGRREPQPYLHLHLHAWPTQAPVCQALNLQWNELCNPMISCQLKSAAQDLKCRFFLLPAEQSKEGLE